MTVKSDTNMNIRTNQSIKRQAQQIFTELGLDMSTAVNIFLRQVVYRKGIPFDVCLDRPNDTTLKALEEGDRMLNDPNTKQFTGVDELFTDLGR